MAGERLGADVRHLLQRLLAPARRPADALAETDQRIDDERRAREADDRQPGVVIEQQPRRKTSSASDSRARSPSVSDTARCTCATSLVIRDISRPLVFTEKNAADWPRMWRNSRLRMSRTTR